MNNLRSKIIKGLSISLMLIVFQFVVVLPCFAIEHIRYVDVNNGNFNNDGLTKANAWKNFDDALNKCAQIPTSADYNIILYLAEGDYSVTNGEQASMHLVPVDNIAIKGMSFEGVNIIGSSGWDTGLRIAKNNVTITELTFQNFNNAGVEIASSDNVKILNCSINDCFDGIVVSPDMTDIPSNPQIIGNRINGFINCGIKINADSAPAFPVIQRNTINTNSALDSDETSAIYIQNTNQLSFDIAGNDIINPSSAGKNSYGVRADITGGLSSAVIKSNRFSGIAQSINFNFSSSGTSSSPFVVNNLISDVSFLADTASVAFIVNAGNLFPECYHNTIDGGGVGNKGMFFKNVEGTLNPKIKYNLVSNFVSSGIENDSTAPATIAAADFVYNNAYGNTGNDYLVSELAASNIEQDPLYAYDPVSGNTDFSIPANSPCVDIIPAEENDPVSNDIMGTSRPRSSNSSAPENSDIGAYEYPYMNYEFTMPGGTGLASDYRLLTLPLDIFSEEFLSRFEQYYGSYDTSKWRIFAYDAENAVYLEISDTFFGDFAGRGSAFWVISTDNAFTSDAQIFEGNLIKDTEPFTKELHQGWNLIALPWPKAKQDHIVRLGDLRIDGNSGEYSLTSGDQAMTDSHIWSYEPTTPGSATTNGYIKIENSDSSLEIGKGYWLKVNFVNVRLTIPPPEIWYKSKTKKISREYSVSADDELPPSPPAVDGVFSAEGTNACFIDAI